MAVGQASHAASAKLARQKVFHDAWAHLPCNLVLMTSKGWRMSTATEPAVPPATVCFLKEIERVVSD